LIRDWRRSGGTNYKFKITAHELSHRADKLEGGRRMNRMFCLALTGYLAAAVPPTANAAEPTVVELMQLACQFLESEGGIDRHFTTKRKADCDAINAKTAEQRLGEAKPLELRPGKYVFRVTNKNVPYELGFWLRGSGVGRVALPSVSGGGLMLGQSRDYVIDLVPGTYIYSCPLNTTPDYRLVVKQ
jgi:hypothetical protein